MLNLGSGELLLMLVVLTSWVLPVWAIVDAARRSETDFDAIGSSKTTQIIVLVVSAIICGPIGTILSAVYLLTTRRQLRKVAAVRA